MIFGHFMCRANAYTVAAISSFGAGEVTRLAVVTVGAVKVGIKVHLLRLIILDILSKCSLMVCAVFAILRVRP